MEKYIISLILFLSVLRVSAQQLEDFKARYILNFANQTEWPASYRTGNFSIAVVGSSPVFASLQKVAKNQKVSNQNVDVVQFSKVANIEKCHILFVPESESKNLKKIIEKTAGYSTLLITEKDGLCKEGSMINFVIVNKRLNFEASKANMSKQGLKMTSYLEKLAIIVN